ncbi:MAG: hypothetical protein QG608_1128 [Actinomycetota bacterium]|nr:hypothetical protein [Actinomycetota bacterium]
MPAAQGEKAKEGEEAKRPGKNLRTRGRGPRERGRRHRLAPLRTGPIPLVAPLPALRILTDSAPPTSTAARYCRGQNSAVQEALPLAMPMGHHRPRSQRPYPGHALRWDRSGDCAPSCRPPGSSPTRWSGSRSRGRVQGPAASEGEDWTDGPPKSWEILQGPGNGRDLPEPQRWAAHLTQAALEVAEGVRPPGQLAPWATEEVRTALAQMGEQRAAPGLRRARRITVRSVRVTHPAQDVAEACALVTDGQNLRAVALRLEKGDGRWRITAMEIG